MKTDAFRGEVFRGDEWRDRDFAGKRVAVIASGPDAASVVPAVVGTARAVKVFQTEPSWILPRLLEPLGSAVGTGERVSAAERSIAERLARLHLFARVRDPWIRRLLTPNTRFDRPAFAVSNTYYAALQQPSCKLVHWPVYAIVEQGVRSAEGVEHRVDCIVLPDPTVLESRPDPSPSPREQPST